MLDGWRERYFEEQREKEECLVGTPCMFCNYHSGDCQYEYQTCGVAYYDKYEETWLIDR